MYRFIGYLVKNQMGDVVQFAPGKLQAEQFCQQNGLPPGNITQAYEMRHLEYKEPAPQEADTTDSQPQEQPNV